MGKWPPGRWAALLKSCSAPRAAWLLWGQTNGCVMTAAELGPWAKSYIGFSSNQACTREFGPHLLCGRQTGSQQTPWQLCTPALTEQGILVIPGVHFALSTLPLSKPATCSDCNELTSWSGARKAVRRLPCASAGTVPCRELCPRYSSSREVLPTRQAGMLQGQREAFERLP